MKKSILLILVALSCLFQASIFAKNTATTDTDPPTAKCKSGVEIAEFEQLQFDGTHTLSSGIGIAQLYAPPPTPSITKIKVRFSSTTIIGDVTLSFYEGENPNSPISFLQAVTLSNLSIIDDYAVFEFSSPISISNLNSYHFTLQTTGSYEVNTLGNSLTLGQVLLVDSMNTPNPSPTYVPQFPFSLTFSVFTHAIGVVLDPAGNASIAPSDVDDGSSDACGVKSLSLSTSTFDCSSVLNNPNIVTLQVTDNNDNQASCTAVVFVRDTVPPTLTCNDLTLEVPEITPDDVYNTPSEDCGIWKGEISASILDCIDGESFARVFFSDYS